MKVVHINTQSYGGAAVVAKRLHGALRNSGVDSVLLTRFGLKNELPQHYFEKESSLRYFLRKKLSKEPWYSLAKAVQDFTKHPNLKNQRAGFELFSPLYHTEDLPREDILRSSDVIHLHWVNSYIDYSNFFRKFSDKRFVWTLHDMNPITGGCHHSDGCMHFVEDCAVCPQLEGTRNNRYSHEILHHKITGLQPLSDDQMIVVSPSKWLHTLSSRSRLLGRFKNVHINNPTFEVAPLLFEQPKSDIRSKLNLPGNKKVILFVSDNLKNPRKGIDFLFKAMLQLESRDQVSLVGIGHPAPQPEGLDVTYTGSISDSQILALYYYAADVFATATLGENSPLVVIEALSCGTPVVASAVGGLLDLVTKENGILFPVGRVEAMANALHAALFSQTFDRQKIRAQALNEHDSGTIAMKYQNVYNSLNITDNHTC